MAEGLITNSVRSSLMRGLVRTGQLAAGAAERLQPVDEPTLKGDRWIEWSFCFARLTQGPGLTLDFGADIGFLSLAAAQRGHDVVALDRMPSGLDYDHPRVEAIQGDILDEPLRDRRFDQIVNCSSVEHVGLMGRYESRPHPDGDIRAMAILRDLLADGGQHILTVPVGRDMTCEPYHRIYGEDRLPRLLEGYETLEEQYWLKEPRTASWVQGERAAALDTQGSKSFYSLGLFVLRSARP